MSKLAVIQKAPPLLSLEDSMTLAVDSIAEAAREVVDLVVFPETFLAGYPTWVWHLQPEEDRELLSELHDRLLQSSINLERYELDPICRAAIAHGVTVVIGMHERDGTYSQSTLYNTCVVIGPDGEILNRHRKMVPTNPERTIWGRGDASGLRVVETPAGRISTLLCWENYLPLARHALYAQGVQLYIAPTWDDGPRWQATLRHIAAEGGCWVVGSACPLRRSDIPRDFPGRERAFGDLEEQEWLHSGGAVVLEPFEGPVAGPLHQELGVLFAEYDLDAVARARRTLDVVGHYHRPDLFDLKVDRRAQVPVFFQD